MLHELRVINCHHQKHLGDVLSFPLRLALTKRILHRIKSSWVLMDRIWEEKEIRCFSRETNFVCYFVKYKALTRLLKYNDVIFEEIKCMFQWCLWNLNIRFVIRFAIPKCCNFELFSFFSEAKKVFGNSMWNKIIFIHLFYKLTISKYHR